MFLDVVANKLQKMYIVLLHRSKNSLRFYLNAIFKRITVFSYQNTSILIGHVIEFCNYLSNFKSKTLQRNSSPNFISGDLCWLMIDTFTVPLDNGYIIELISKWIYLLTLLYFNWWISGYDSKSFNNNLLPIIRPYYRLSRIVCPDFDGYIVENVVS